MTQKEALDILKTGKNIFLTGPAGSGKTHLLNSYIDFLRTKRVSVAVTASTGIAATHMNGRTIHSWSAIGIKDSLTKNELRALSYNKKIQSRIRNADVLIVDEISMLDAQRLDLVDTVCRTIRKDSSPFGGLQVVLSGDFFQLPPVADAHDEGQPDFAFKSRLWRSGKLIVCYLEHQYRQQDSRYFDILNAIRNNRASNETRSILTERYNMPIQGVAKPTKLYSHNEDVDAINDFELSHITSPPVPFEMQSSGNEQRIRQLKKNCLAPEVLTLKEGALVMFVKNNFDQGYVNGTLGVVVGFDDDSQYPLVKTRAGYEILATPTSWEVEEDGEILARISQIPLRLAWAITIHKSQGMSLDCAEIDLSKAFTEGMGYVALSRVRTLPGITLIGLNDMALRVNSEISTFDAELQQLSRKTQKEIELFDRPTIRKLHKAFLDRIA